VSKAEAVNANSGLGYCVDDKGRVNWDLVENADMRQVEVNIYINFESTS